MLIESSYFDYKPFRGKFRVDIIFGCGKHKRNAYLALRQTKRFFNSIKKKKPPAEIQKNKRKNVLVWAAAYAADEAAGRDQLFRSNAVRALLYNRAKIKLSEFLSEF